MAAIWLLTKKNIKLLIRARWSALIIIFAPLLLILLLGLSYNTSNNFGIIVGVYSPQFSDDVNAFTNLLKQEQFTIKEYHNNISTCVNDIKNGEVHTCISLPENLHVEDNLQKEITFYVDPSRINLVWMVQETVKSKFNLKSQEISQTITQDILSRVGNTKESLTAKQRDVGTIKDKTTSVSQNTATVKGGLSALDLQAPTTTYDLGDLSNLSTLLTTSKDKLDFAVTAVKSANLDENKTKEILAALHAAETSLDKTISSFGEGGTAQAVLNMQKDLDAAKAKLIAASSAVSSSTQTLTTSATTLTELVSALESLKASLSEMQSRLDTLKVTDANTISSPFVTKIEKVNGDRTYLNYLFPALLVLVIMFSTLLLGTTLVMIEKHSPAFVRNFFVPVSKFTFIASTYLTNLVLIIIQILVILGISLFFLNGALGSLALVALILFLGASVFTFIGMVVGYIFMSEETGILASISLGSVMLLFSGVILPLEAVPPLIRIVASFNPFVLTEKLVREVFLFGVPLSQNIVGLSILAGYAIILFFIIWVLETLLHKHLVERFMHKHHVFHRQREKRLKNI